MEKVQDELRRTDTSTLLRHVDGSPGSNRCGLVKASDSKSPIADEHLPSKEKRVLEQQGDTWRVEGYNNEKLVEVPEMTFRQTLMIRNCYGSTIRSQSKSKAVLIEGCVRTNIVLNTVVSTLEVINCEKLKLQVLGCANSLSIDKTNGIDVFLSKNSKDILIATSKSGSMNVNFPLSDEEDAEWVERPIPEQFEHRIANNHKIVSEVSSLYSC